MTGVYRCSRWLTVALVSLPTLFLFACSSKPGHGDGGGAGARPETRADSVVRAKATGDAIELTEYYKKANEEAAAQLHPVNFYGVALDQNDQPVVDAKVECEVCYSPFGSKSSRITLRTDRNGRFEIVSGFGSRFQAGHDMTVERIEADGYETFLLREHPDVSFSFHGSPDRIHHADQKSPVVFRLRKMRGSPTFMFAESERLDVDKDSMWWVDLSGVSYGLARRTARDAAARPPGNTLGAPGWWDFVVEYRVEDDGKTVALVFRALEEDGGFIASANLLTDAPESGYQREIAFRHSPATAPSYVLDMGDKRYIYTKTRKPSVYGIIILRDVYGVPVYEYARAWDGKEPFIKFTLNARMNPYGDRNIEMFVEKSGKQPDNSYVFTVEGEICFRLAKEATLALEKGRLPVRPDMRKLTEECQREVKRLNARPGLW